MSDWNTNLINDMRAHDGHATSGPFVGRQVLILTTTGAKTGERRESPLAYTLDGDRIVVVASKGGSDTNPAWYHNVVAHPNVTVELDGTRFEAIASVATGTERRRLYDGHVAVHPGFADYEKKTERVIPVIVLQRRAASAAA
jgi:deazaflavin-dependent oxidoreductase (nitroreductase family)